MPRRDADEPRPRKKYRRGDEESGEYERPRKKPNTRLVLILALSAGGVVLLSCIGGGIHALSRYRDSGQAAEAERASAPAASGAVAQPASKPVTAEEPVDRGNIAKLFDPFEQNPIQAEADYMGKVVEIKDMGLMNKDGKSQHMYFSLDVGKPRENRSVIADIANDQEAAFAAVKPSKKVVTGVSSSRLSVLLPASDLPRSGEWAQIGSGLGVTQSAGLAYRNSPGCVSSRPGADRK